jgi:molybdenum cofactor guanylyltransferase
MLPAQPDTVVVVVLAGGLGRRIGGGKAQRLLQGRPLLAHVVARLAPQAGPGRLLLNVNDGAAKLAAYGLPVVADTLAGRLGPLAGVLAAMQFAKQADWVVSAPTDAPFLPLDLVTTLLRCQQDTGASIVLAESEAGLAQVCGLWSVQLAEPLAQSLASGQNKVLDFAARHAFATVRFPPQQIGGRSVDPFFNINTPDDLAAAERLLSC